MDKKRLMTADNALIYTPTRLGSSNLLHTKRVFVCGLHQESNSFNPIYADLDSFEICKADKSTDPAVIGGIQYLLDEGAECIYGTFMTSQSGAPLTDRAVSFFVNTIIKEIENQQFDGILWMMHGATMSVSSDDVCGDVFEAVRRIVGDIPMSAQFDLHANITKKVAKNINYICGYHQYPHTDVRETGVRAAKMLCEHFKGNTMKTAVVQIPMIAPAHAYTTTRGSLLSINEKAEQWVVSGKIADYTVFQVQPWLDAVEMASAAVVIAPNQDTANQAASELAKDNFEIRKELQGAPLLTVEDAIQKALTNTVDAPIVISDSADSRGAGSTGDSAEPLRALLPYSNELRAAVSVFDAAAIDRAFELGVGATGDFELGATIAPQLSKPVLLKNATVRSLHNGSFYMHGPAKKGCLSQLGKTAVLELGGILVLLYADGSGEYDLNFYRSFGIDVENCDFVSVKACTSFRAGYEKIAAEIYNVSSPGAACPTLTALPYKKRPKLYPFEEITENDICHI